MSTEFTTIDALFASARWGWYLAAFLLLGAGSYAPFLFQIRTALHTTHPELSTQVCRRAARLGFWAAIALLCFGLIRVYLQLRTLSDPDEPVTRELFVSLLETAWGAGWARQMAMALVALLGFLAAGRGSGFGWLVATAASGGLGFTTAMTGHAVTAKAGPGGLFLDAAHVWAGGLWLGGLAVLLIAGVGATRAAAPEARSLIVRSLVADFSRRALVFGPLTMLLGVWLAIRYLGWRWPLALGQSGYTTALAAKLIALAGIALFGAYNWRVTQPRLGGPDGLERLRRFSALELSFGVILLGVTALLVALPLPEGRL